MEKALNEYDEREILDWCRPDEEFDFDHKTRSIAAVEDSPDCFFEPTIDSFVDAFKKWVDGISLAGVGKVMDLPLGGIYLTFNYTETLERIYGIPEANILHIHGSRIRGDEYIFGHNNYRDLADVCSDEEYWVTTAYEKIVLCMNALVKDALKIINGNRNFFDTLGHIEEVVVLGHSFSEIDWPYFEEIVSQTGKDSPWVISYYSKEDQQRINSFVKLAGLKNATSFDFEEVFQED